MHLTCELPVKAACAAVDTPALAADDQEFQVRAESPITSTSADTKCQNELVAAACPTDPGFREVGEAETLRSSEDTFYTADSGSNTRTSTPIASTARTSISGPPSSTEFLSLITSVKSSKDFKGTYFKGMVVPIGKATHSSKRTLASVGVQPDSQDAFAGEVDLFAGSGIPEPPPTSCANQNIGEGAGKISQAEATHVTAEPSVSDGIPGEISSHSPTATMGPREVWDQSRADRKQRYDSLQSGSSYSDASTDECSDFGSELEMTPNLFRVPTVQQEAMNREDRSPGTKRIFRRRHKSTSPLKFRRKYKFRTNDPEHPLNLDHIGPPTMSEPQHISNGTEPVQMSIEEYMANKQLRLDLRRSRADVLLYEQSNAANASTAPDRIFITSALDPNDELDRRRMNPSYLRRAHMTREELKATPISSSDEDDVDNVSNAATAGGTSCDATLQGTSNSAYEYMDVESWKSSRDISRGRRRERSPSPTNGNSIAGVYGKRNNSTTRQRAVAGAPTPVERSISRFRSPSADYDTLMQEYLDSEHKFPLPQGLRQRLADISMVERRQILAQRDRPRVVHKLEVKGGKLEDAYDSEAEESVKEEDDGWSAALVDAGLEDWMVPAPIPHAGW
ncbi:MAG: hypothetical protein LQ350_004618 [Teloschistes chrysophthalmus]|nr:MAG: hypothetical protein LQ350_004618 [Niorma chrysophthalma]